MNFNDPHFVEQLRMQMLSFARQQIVDYQKAEDIVQESLLKAYQYQDSFSGQSSMKTWVFAILKNKVIDELRKKQPVNLSDLITDEIDTEEFIDKLFQEDGHWQPEFAPGHWQNPEDWVEMSEFWRVFDHCVNHLPAKYAQIFMLREVVDLSTEEICQEMQLSIANVNTIMYRCRIKLRSCLEATWL